MTQLEGRFNREIEVRKQIDLSYLLHVPTRELEAPQGWPLILFLHGRDQRGDDLDQLKIRALPKFAAEQEDFPFIVLSPQCPEHYIWPFVFDGIMALLDEVIEQYPVDPKRIYLTGLSMGGYAAWDLAMEFPDRFAGIVPICGSTSTGRIHLLKDVPVWTFHGALDDVVPLDEVERVVTELTNAGGEVKFTVYPEGKHDIWEDVYHTKELYTEFFQKSL